MCNPRRLAVFLTLVFVGMMSPLGAVHAGTITGTLYETDGVTMITPSTSDTIRVEALDYRMNPFSPAVVQNCTTTTYTLNPTPTATDKSVYINVTRKGVNVITVGPIRGNKPSVQTVDLLIPKPAPVLALPEAAAAYFVAPEPVLECEHVCARPRCRCAFFRRCRG